MQISEIRGALARGYCSPANAHKELDATLIEAMATEIAAVEAAEADLLGELVKTLRRTDEQLSEAIHTAFRKASDHPSSNSAWHAIKSLPPEEWSAIVNWVLWSLGIDAILARAEGGEV